MAEDCLPPPGWKVEVRVRKSGRRDKYYTDPDSGYIFRSLKDIDRYLLSGKLGKNVSKSRAKEVPFCEVKVDASKSSGESSGKKILVYGRSKKSRLVDLRSKLIGNGTRKDVLVADHETKREVTKATREKEKVDGTKNETKREGPEVGNETWKVGAGGKYGTRKVVTRAQSKLEMDVTGVRSKTEEEGAGGEGEAKKGVNRGKTQIVMEVNGSRKESNCEGSMGKSERKETSGTRNETKNGNFNGKSNTKEVTGARNESKREHFPGEDYTKEVNGIRNETKKEGATGNSIMKSERTRHKKKTMKEVGEAENKTNKELTRARTETKKECIGSRKVKRKKLSEVQDTKMTQFVWNEETSPFFIHDPDQCNGPTLQHYMICIFCHNILSSDTFLPLPKIMYCDYGCSVFVSLRFAGGANTTLGLEYISEIMDAVQKEGDAFDAPCLPAPAIGELLVRQAAGTQNQNTTINPSFNTNIYHPNFPSTSRWLVKQERDLGPIRQVPSAFELNNFGSKSNGREIRADSTIADNCPATIVRFENEAAGKNSLPQLMPDIGDVWFDPCIDFAIKTLTGTDPAIEEYFLQQQQLSPAKPERVSHCFQQQQSSSSKFERFSYYLQQQPKPSNLEMVSHCYYDSSQQPRPICTVEELRFEDMAIDDKSKPKCPRVPSSSIRRVK